MRADQPKDPDRRGKPKKPLSILCAEDEVSVGLILKYALESEGHKVEWVEDGGTALARALDDLTAYDLVITDHNMPSLGGLALVEKLRENKFPGRIIVHSSNLRETAAEAYRSLSVDHILSKPAALEDLLAAVNKV